MVVDEVDVVVVVVVTVATGATNVNLSFGFTAGNASLSLITTRTSTVCALFMGGDVTVILVSEFTTSMACRSFPNRT